MAQTKAKPKAKAKSSSTKSRSRAKAKTPKARSSKSRSTKPKPIKAASNGSAGKSSRVGAVKSVAGKAKVPLVAGGAALAGAAGGMALATTKRARKGTIDKALEFATEMQRARQPQNGRRRSPVEVVLQGLTARR